MLNHRLHVVQAPHRWYALEEKVHGVNQLRVIGGVCDRCLKAGMQFYDGRDTHSLSSYSSFSSSLFSLLSSPHDVTDLVKVEMRHDLRSYQDWLEFDLKLHNYLN